MLCDNYFETMNDFTGARISWWLLSIFTQILKLLIFWFLAVCYLWQKGHLDSWHVNGNTLTMNLPKNHSSSMAEDCGLKPRYVLFSFWAKVPGFSSTWEAWRGLLKFGTGKLLRLLTVLSRMVTWCLQMKLFEPWEVFVDMHQFVVYP